MLGANWQRLLLKEAEPDWREIGWLIVERTTLGAATGEVLPKSRGTKPAQTKFRVNTWFLTA